MGVSIRNNMPSGHLDPQGYLSQDSFLDEAFRGEYSGTNLIYKGFADVGTSTAAQKWQIAKLAYDGNNNVLSITWPLNSNGACSNFYEFVWDDRATYTYI